MSKIGIIGGSGLYNIEGIKKLREVKITTPFGAPSDTFKIGELEGVEVVFLPRHNKKHNISPSEINYRANIFGMKKLGVERIVSVSACGSLKKELKPLDFVIPYQFVDRTNHARKMSFFEKGIVAHVSFADPVCLSMASIVYDSAKKLGMDVHLGGTYLNMEGPAFSTKAESNLYRSWGMDIIGMTNMAEARLAREAEICFTTLAAITDYDCWYEAGESVSVEMVIANLCKNTDNAKRIIKEFLPKIAGQRTCSCKDALKYSIVTPQKSISKATKKRLSILIDKYI